jgi:4-amino-4-deoxy-L-arabinose transferase-like glycosyltransferase
VLDSNSVDSVSTAPNLSTSRSIAARIGWAVLIIATLSICYFSHLGAIGFVGPDEPRYAWIARDMAETGDWVTPRLYGKPWFEKPPLYYWGGALGVKLFGVSEVSARLPSAISALFATLALAWLAWRIYGAETARWLLLLLPTSVGMIGFSHAAATDMPFSGMLTIAMVCTAVVLGLTKNEHTPILPRTPWLALFLFGFFLGLAVLAKGPAGIILCGGAVFFWALVTKRWRDAFRLLHPVAIASFCITTLPWYILCARRNPDFFRIFIIEHNFKRYLTPEFQHIQPFWFYVPVLLVATLPWTVCVVWAAMSGAIKLWRTRLISEPSLLLVCWSVFCLVFFALSKSKLPGYVLPALPAILLVTARFVVSTYVENRVFARWLFVVLGVTCLILGTLIYWSDGHIPLPTDIRPAPSVQLLCLEFLAIGILAGVLAFRRRLQASALAAAIGMVFIVATTNVRELDAGVSTRAVLSTAIDHLTPEQLANTTVYQLRPAYKFQVNYYLHREAREWSPQNPRHSIIFTSREHMDELRALGAHCPSYVVFPAVLVCEVARGEQPILVSVGSDGRQPQ